MTFTPWRRCRSSTKARFASEGLRAHTVSRISYVGVFALAMFPLRPGWGLFAIGRRDGPDSSAGLEVEMGRLDDVRRARRLGGLEGSHRRKADAKRKSPELGTNSRRRIDPLRSDQRGGRKFYHRRSRYRVGGPFGVCGVTCVANPYMFPVNGGRWGREPFPSTFSVMLTADRFPPTSFSRGWTHGFEFRVPGCVAYGVPMDDHQQSSP